MGDLGNGAHVMLGALIATYANPLIVVDGAGLDGGDSMKTGAGLTGAADGKTGIFSAWVRMDGGVQIVLFSGATTVGGGTFRILIFRSSGNTLTFQFFNAAGAEILRAISSAAYGTSVTWRHLLASWDLAAGTFNLYVNDVSDLASIPTNTNDTIDYTLADWALGAIPDATNRWNGGVADLYFAPGQFLDFSNPYNRRKFISASGKPVHLGATGALPTGTAPLVYQHVDDAEAPANFATNRATGGNFTITGTLDTASSSPSD